MISSILLESFIIDAILGMEPISLAERLKRHKYLRKTIAEDLPELHEKSLQGNFYALFQKYQGLYKTSITNPAKPFNKILLLIMSLKRTGSDTIEFFKCADCMRSFKLYNLLMPDENLKCPYCQSEQLYHDLDIPNGILTAETAENNMRMADRT